MVETTTAPQKGTKKNGSSEKAQRRKRKKRGTEASQSDQNEHVIRTCLEARQESSGPILTPSRFQFFKWQQHAYIVGDRSERMHE